jgi:hypothetical protein
MAGMRLGLRPLVLAVSVVLGLAACAEQAPPVKVLNHFGHGAAELGGPWQFHLGDNPAWAAPDLDDATGHNGWEQVLTSAPWGAQGHRSYSGYAWYRIHLHITPASGISGDYTLLAPRLESTGEFYWNGVLVARSGKMPPYPAWTYDDPTVEGDELPQVLHLGPLRDGVLAVRVWFRPFWSYDDGLQGGFYSTPILGSPHVIDQYDEAVKYRELRSSQYSYALYSVYALLMLLGLAGWLRDRGQRALLWMGIFCLGKLGTAILGFLQTSISFQAGYFWEQIWLAVRDVGLWYVLLWLLELNQDRRLARWTAILAWIDLLAAFADGVLVFFDAGDPSVARTVQIADAILTVPLVGLSCYSLVLVALGARKPLNAPRRAVAIFAFFSAGIADAIVLLQQGRRFTHWTIDRTLSTPLFTIVGNPFDAETLASTGLIFTIIYAIYSYVIENSHRQSAIAQEISNAREVQQVLVPQVVPEIPGFKFESVYIPAGEVGGDFFQVIPIPGSGVLVIIGDVSGKGLPAAMTVSLIVGTVRTLAHYTRDPSEILAAMNHRMLTRSHGGFTTCLVLRIDTDGHVTAANAGHLSPYRNGEEVSLENGFPLGISAQALYPETRLRLAPSDTLTFISDGVVEARDSTGELYGFKRTQSISTESAQQIALTAQHFGQEDDITVLTLTFAPQPVLAATP